jgi:Arginine deiminase
LTDTGSDRAIRAPSLLDALIPLITLAVLIAGSIALFGLDALDGPIQVALFLCAIEAALIVLKNGHTRDDVERAAQGALSSITSAVFILLAIMDAVHTFSLRPSDGSPGVEVIDEGSKLFVDVVAESLGLPDLRVIETGGDVYQNERQQWDSGNNAVASCSRMTATP